MNKTVLVFLHLESEREDLTGGREWARKGIGGKQGKGGKGQRKNRKVKYSTTDDANDSGGVGLVRRL